VKNKALLITFIVVVALAVSGIASLGIAATQNTEDYPPIVQKIAERFNLKPAEVNAVFEEERKEKEAKLQERFEERLDQAVKDGDISEKQKSAIIAKSKEVQEKMAAIRDLAPEERRDALNKLHTELSTWAKDNDIDMRYMMLGKKGFKHGPGGFKRGFGGCGFDRSGSPKGETSYGNPDKWSTPQSGVSL